MVIILCVYVLILLDLRDDMISLSRLGTGYERPEIQRFYCKNVLLRRYGSCNGLIMLHYLELLISTEKSQNKQHYQTH